MDQTSTNPDHQKRRPSDPKAPVFIPPFRKKVEAPKDCVPTAAAQLPGAFVPPIRKKDASGSVYVKDSPRSSGGSPAITSFNGENGTDHTTRKPEDQKAATETKQLENPTIATCKTKGRR